MTRWSSECDVRPMPVFAPLTFLMWTNGICSRGWPCGPDLVLALRFFSMLLLCEFRALELLVLSDVLVGAMLLVCLFAAVACGGAMWSRAQLVWMCS